MHPVLFAIDLTPWRLPLLPWLALLAAGAAGVALIGWRMRRLDLLLPGLLGTSMAGIAAVALRDHAFVPTQLVVTTFGALLAVALVVAVPLTVSLAARDGQRRELVTAGCLVAVIAGLLGARLGHVVASTPAAVTLVRVLDLRSGGLFGYAGLVAGLAALVLFLRGSEARWPLVADAAMPGVAFGTCAVAFGSYLLGSGFGPPLGEHGAAWLRALGTFPRWPPTVLEGAGSPAWLDHVARGLIGAQTSASAPVHPTQLYLALAGVALVVLVTAVRRARTFEGEVFLAAVIGLGAVRFVVDFWRGDPQAFPWGPTLPAPLAVGLGLLVLTVALVVGPSRRIPLRSARLATQGALLLVPLVGYLAARPATYAVRFTLGQWLALATALAAALAWERWERTRPMGGPT